MRKARILLTSMALTGAALFATAAPAQAAARELRGVYYDYSFCHWYGNYGIQQGQWSQFSCEFVPNGSQTPPTGYYFLWSYA